MKILKYILFLILGVVIIFFGIGLLSPTIEYGHKITVNKSLKEAWAITQDESKYDQWLEGFKSMELIDGEKGAVGSKYKIIVTPGEGQTDFEMTETIISIKDLEHVSMHFDSEMMDFDQTMLFTETNGEVSVETKSKVSPKGIMLRSIFAISELLGDIFQVQEEKNIEALKKVINENKDVY